VDETREGEEGAEDDGRGEAAAAPYMVWTVAGVGRWVAGPLVGGTALWEVEGSRAWDEGSHAGGEETRGPGAILVLVFFFLVYVVVVVWCNCSNLLLQYLLA
jgi:hypothetical protein